MKKFEYQVFAFRQQTKAPIELVFVAKADEITMWAGVPRKSDELLAGYQRIRDARRIDREVVPFFQDAQNSSPTAIIISLRSDSGIGKCTLTVDGKEISNADDESVSTTPQPGLLVIELDEEKVETDQIFEVALHYIDQRLGAGGVSGSAMDVDSDEDQEISDELDEEAEALGEADEVIHLGTVTLQKMKEALQNKANWSKPAFRDAIKDYSKPASIIDGQHRAFAASKLGLPFVVCGLFNAPWSEQVFQFTVVNLKPKRIPPSLITSIAGLSLTPLEQQQVGTRLQKAGVKMAEVSIMSLVAYDPRSPFNDLIDMSTSPNSSQSKLGYSAAKRIAAEWYRAARTSLTLIMETSTGEKGSRARMTWHDEQIWFDFFVSFWGAVQGRYPQLWQKDGNKLFIGAQLWALQETLLREADSQKRSSWQSTAPTKEERIEELKKGLLEIVNDSLAYFPDQLWTVAWSRSQFDTSDDRIALVNFFTQFLLEGKKSGVWKSWTKHDFIQGS